MGSGCSSHFLSLLQSGPHSPAVSGQGWRHGVWTQAAVSVSPATPGDTPAAGDTGTAVVDGLH